MLAIDSETSGLDPRRDELVGVSMSSEPGKAYAAYIKEDFKTLVIQGGSRIPEQPTSRLVMHNAAFDVPALRRLGWELECDADTMLMAYILGKPRLGLKPLSETELGVKMQGIDDLIQQGQYTMRDVPWDLVVPYACSDADQTLQLYQKFSADLAQEPKLQALFDLEMRVLPMLIRMSDIGVKVDQQKLTRMGGEIKKEITRLEAEIIQDAGEPDLDLSSPQQLSNLLFGKLGLEPIRSTQTPGQFSTDKDSLTELADEHPIANKLLEWREHTTLLGTFVGKLPQLIKPDTGRIHTTWRQARVVTGRLSSQDPNLMNIPVHGRIGDALRAAFIPDEGNLFIGADYSGIEVRVLAHMSGDERLCEMINGDEDPHAWTASYVFGLPIEEVSKGGKHEYLRALGKTLFFAILYRATDHRIANLLRSEISVDEARNLCQRRGKSPKGEPYRMLGGLVINGIYEIYPGVGLWQERTIQEARDTGYTSSLLGRRRPLPYIRHSSEKARAADERIACNHPIQATAGGDIMKLAMAELWEAFKGCDWFWPLLQIHDELQNEAPKEKAKEVEWAMAEIMPNVLPLEVPLEVETKVGRSWAETH